MNKIKRFLDIYIPTETCNLRCHYCYITQKRKFNNKLAEFKYSPDIIQKSLSIKRLGGKCLINLCAGGETLLSYSVIEIIKVLLEEGHYVMVVTNGTLSKRFDEIVKWDSKLLKRLFFKFSFHYLELKSREMLDKYFENIKKVKSHGCSFTVEITPSDELIPYIDEVKKICLEHLGALCHVTIARDDRTNGIEILSKYSFDKYKNIWSTFDSELFNFKYNIFYKKREEFCYAGEWSVYINLGTGDMRQCYCGDVLDNIYNNVDGKLKFKAIGHKCNLAHCYNGHAFLTIGSIPELKTPTYAELRDRKDLNGDYWLNDEMKMFMSQKLKDNNFEYSYIKKKINNIEGVTIRAVRFSRVIIRKIKNKF